MSDPHFIAAEMPDDQAILSLWSALLPADCRLLGTSLFGDLFVKRTSGEIDMLDVVAGEVRTVAVCVEEFEWDLTQQEQQEELLMQSLASAAIANGLQPAISECLAFRTQPMLGGQLRLDNLVRWNLLAYHAGLAKLWPQIKKLSPGTEVVFRPKGPTT